MNAHLCVLCSESSLPDIRLAIALASPGRDNLNEASSLSLSEVLAPLDTLGDRGEACGLTLVNLGEYLQHQVTIIIINISSLL